MDNLRTKQSNQSDLNTHTPGDIFSFRPPNGGERYSNALTMSPKAPRSEAYTTKKLPDNFN